MALMVKESNAGIYLLTRKMKQSLLCKDFFKRSKIKYDNNTVTRKKL